MEPDTHLITEHLSVLSTGIIAVFTAAASWTGATIALHNHTKKLKNHGDRIDVLEKTTVPITTCKEAKKDCKEGRADIADDVNDRLDKIMTMFADLEERRSERWREFEIRRELSKEELQKTLRLMSKQLGELQGVVEERRNIYRKTNGVKCACSISDSAE